MKNGLYWSYNLPLQVYTIYDDDHKNIIGYHILNYSPREDHVSIQCLEDVLGEQSHEEFFNTAAKYLENLAIGMRLMAQKKNDHIYYHDTDWSYYLDTGLEKQIEEVLDV